MAQSVNCKYNHHSPYIDSEGDITGWRKGWGRNHYCWFIMLLLIFPNPITKLHDALSMIDYQFIFQPKQLNYYTRYPIPNMKQNVYSHMI